MDAISSCDADTLKLAFISIGNRLYLSAFAGSVTCLVILIIRLKELEPVSRLAYAWDRYKEWDELELRPFLKSTGSEIRMALQHYPKSLAIIKHIVEIWRSLMYISSFDFWRKDYSRMFRVIKIWEPLPQDRLKKSGRSEYLDEKGEKAPFSEEPGYAM